VRIVPLEELHYRSLKFHFFQPHFVQEHFSEDCDRCTEFSEITLAWNGENYKLLKISCEPTMLF
jgi:hypothetical protein